MTENKINKLIANFKKGYKFHLVDACADLEVSVSCEGDCNVFDNITFKEIDNTKTEAELIEHRNEMQSIFDDKVNQKDTDKANGNQKLLDLGLTQAEATALTGYTPPSEE
jgi:hypothetical protein